MYSLNPYLRAMAWLVVGTVVLVLAVPAEAEPKNMFFAGRLVAEPCTLRAADALVRLEFPSVATRDLYRRTRTQGQPVVLHLEGCDTTLGKNQVSLYFDGTESSGLPGLLKLSSTVSMDGTAELATGVAIGLERADGTPLPLYQTHPAGVLMKDGSNEISFLAYLQGEPEALKERTIGVGSFMAAMTFKLTYE